MWRWQYIQMSIMSPSSAICRKVGSEKLILAQALVETVFGEEKVRVVERFKGKQLKGKRYHPLFTFLPVDKPAHYVVQGDFVTTEDGTGLVHIAPAFGADDMQMAPWKRICQS
jgi:isoleucyl-tRNA synthetase